MTVKSNPQLKQEIRNLWTRSFVQGGDSWIKLDDVLEKLEELEKQVQETIDELSHKPVPMPHRADSFRTGWLDGVHLGVKRLRELLEAS